MVAREQPTKGMSLFPVEVLLHHDLTSILSIIFKLRYPLTIPVYTKH